MTDEQRAKLMMYHRLLTFLTANLGDFTGTIVATLLAEYEQNIEDIHEATAEQEAGTGAVTARRGQRREVLAELLFRIEDTGKQVGLFLGDPSIVAAFNREPAYSRMADEDLVTAADTLKTVATPLAVEFVARGFAATFLVDLQTKRDAFHASVPAGSTVGPTERIAQKILRQDLITGQFDSTATNRYTGDPASAPKLAEYTSARQVIRVRSQPLEVTLVATRSGNDVSGNVTLSRAAEIGDTVTLRWREQGGPAIFSDGPVTIFPVGDTSTTATVTVTSANPVEVVARVIRGDGRQIDSAPVVV